MRTIKIITAEGPMEIGTNDNDGGIFSRNRDGTWKQWIGNSQTPTFKNSAHLMRYLRSHFFRGEKIKKEPSSAW